MIQGWVCNEKLSLFTKKFGFKTLNDKPKTMNFKIAAACLLQFFVK